MCISLVLNTNSSYNICYFFLSQGQLSHCACVEYIQDNKKEQQNKLNSGRSQLVYFRFTPSTLAQDQCASLCKLKKFKSTCFPPCESILDQEVISRHVYWLLQHSDQEIAVFTFSLLFLDFMYLNQSWNII